MFDSISSYLEHIAQKYPNRTALQIRKFLRTEKYSYKELEELSRQTAYWLVSQKIKEGDMVLIWAPNMPEWVIVFFGSLLAGVVAIPVGLHSTKELVEKYAKQTTPKLLFCSKFYPIELASQIRNNLKIVYLEDILDEVKGAKKVPLPRKSKHELAELVFTSGTTGEPKGVTITHHNILFATEQLSKVVRHYKHYRMLSVLPLSHVMEQIVGLFGPLSLGATIYYIPRINAVTIKKALKKYKITDLGVVPQMLRMFYDSIEFQAQEKGQLGVFHAMLKLSRLLPIKMRRLVFSNVHSELGGKLYMFGVGSAPLDVNLAKAWEAMGVKVVEGYGATETTGGITANRENSRKLGSVGKKLPGVEVKVAKDGEILAKGENVTLGYYNNPDKTKEAFTEDGFFKIGDIGKFDRSGRLYITGRDKFKIVTSAGDKVYPEDVERKLNSHEAVWDSCVFGLKKAEGEIAYACLILKENKQKGLEQIISEVNKELEVSQQIFEYAVWPGKDFPRLHTLKVDRGKVKQAIEENLAGIKPDESKRESAKEDKLIDIISLVCKVDKSKIHESSKLVADFDLDSLRRVTLVSLIEQELGREVGEAEIGPTTTLAELRRLVAKTGSVIEHKKIASWPRSKSVIFLREFLRNFVLFPLVDFFITKLHIVEKQNLNKIPSPSILIFNHVGHFDSSVVLRVLPPNIRQKFFAVADKELYSSRFHSTLLYIVGNAYPLDKSGSNTRQSFEFIADMLESGNVFLVSPEGNISEDGTLQKFKNGPAVLAVETGVPVIPFKIEGYRKIYPSRKPFPYLPDGRGEVTVRVGEPLVFTNKISYEKAANEMFNALDKL